MAIQNASSTQASTQSVAALRWQTWRRTLTYSLLLAGVTAEFVFFALYRMVNLDEGWYLWAGKLVYAGQVLYRDFAYTQMPLLPYVYGAFQQVVGAGLYQGRVLSCLFAALTMLLCVLIVRKRAATLQIDRAGHWAAVSCVLLYGTTLFAIAYLTYTATYALATFWLTLSLYIALTSKSTESATPARAAVATLCLCLAVATRMSAVSALPPLLFFLVWNSTQRKRTSVAVSLTALGALGLLIGPFWLASDGLMGYDIFGFHTDRILSAQRQIEKAWITTQESLGVFLVPIALGSGGLLGGLWRARDAGQNPWGTVFHCYLFELTLGAMIGLMWLVHLTPRTTASYYNTLQAPLFWIVGSLVLTHLVRIALTRGGRTASGLLVLGGVVLINGAFNVAMLRQESLIHIPLRNQIETVRTAADFLRTIEHTDNRIITLNTHLALEAGMEMPPGYEMSIFAYRPTWSTEQAQRYKAINNDLLLHHLHEGADAVAITDFDLERFYGEREQIFRAMWDKYRFAKTVPAFDPFWGNLYIYWRPQFTLPPLDVPLTVQFADTIALRGYDLANEPHEPGAPLRLGLYWQAAATPQHAYTVFVHVVNEAGTLVAGWDNPPCRTVCPTDTWQPGEVLRDDYEIALPESLPPGTYTIQTGMYNSDTGIPLPVLDETGARTSERITLTTIEVNE